MTNNTYINNKGQVFSGVQRAYLLKVVVASLCPNCFAIQAIGLLRVNIVGA